MGSLWQNVDKFLKLSRIAFNFSSSICNSCFRLSMPVIYCILFVKICHKIIVLLLFDCCILFIGGAVQVVAYLFCHHIEGNAVGAADVAFPAIVRPGTQDE